MDRLLVIRLLEAADNRLISHSQVSCDSDTSDISSSDVDTAISARVTREASQH